jgi:hypothetical protein
MGFNNEQKTRINETLRDMQSTDETKEIQRETGGDAGMVEAKVLLSYVREHKDRYIEIGLAVAGQEVSEGELRMLWDRHKTSSASHRRELEEPRTDKPTDTLHMVSSLYPSYGCEAWQNGTWESTVPRVATGIKDRVDRLKAIGNGQVPAVAATAWNLLTEDLNV